MSTNGHGYLKINKIITPFSCIESAYRHMQAVGKKGLEGIALFAGDETTSVFTIKRTIVPEQQALSLEDGLLYAVSGEALYKINVWLYENKMSLIAQIHSHPGAAYHSRMDDAYPIIATVGGVSIVVPNFASGAISVDLWAVYRLSTGNEWIELRKEEKKSLFQIIH